jgi:hypothetical protein
MKKRNYEMDVVIFKVNDEIDVLPKWRFNLLEETFLKRNNIEYEVIKEEIIKE